MVFVIGGGVIGAAVARVASRIGPVMVGSLTSRQHAKPPNGREPLFQAAFQRANATYNLGSRQVHFQKRLDVFFVPDAADK